MPISAKTRWKSTSTDCGGAWRARARQFKRCAVSAISWKRMTRLSIVRNQLLRLVPRGSLARHLVVRLMPAVLVLIMMDVTVTWYFTGTISIEEWLDRDLFWAMLLSQLVLLFIFGWVLIRGIRSGLQSVNRLSMEISQRSID